MQPAVAVFRLIERGVRPMRQIDFRRVLTSDTDQMLLNRILGITYLETGVDKLITEVTFFFSKRNA